MDYIELSLKNVEEKSKELAKKISLEYNPDVVVFISRGAYQIGKVMANYYNVPLLEIFAKRKVGKLKKFISPFLKIIPKGLKKFLREKEFNSNIHVSRNERNVFFDEEKWKEYKNKKNILLVDDSVDTGNTIFQVKNVIEQYFDGAEVVVAALNVFSKSENIIKIDYCLWKETMLNGPWSNDSIENKEFIKMYTCWKEGNK